MLRLDTVSREDRGECVDRVDVSRGYHSSLNIDLTIRILHSYFLCCVRFFIPRIVLLEESLILLNAVAHTLEIQGLQLDCSKRDN